MDKEPGPLDAGWAILQGWWSRPDPARIAAQLPDLMRSARNFIRLAEARRRDTTTRLPLAAHRIALGLQRVDFAPSWFKDPDLFELAGGLWDMDLAIGEIVRDCWGGGRVPVPMPDGSIRFSFVVPRGRADPVPPEAVERVALALAAIEDAAEPYLDKPDRGGRPSKAGRDEQIRSWKAAGKPWPWIRAEVKRVYGDDVEITTLKNVWARRAR